MEYLSNICIHYLSHIYQVVTYLSCCHIFIIIVIYSYAIINNVLLIMLRRTKKHRHIHIRTSMYIHDSVPLPRYILLHMKKFTEWILVVVCHVGILSQLIHHISRVLIPAMYVAPWHIHLSSGNDLHTSCVDASYEGQFL